jgi:transcriptional regulator GlxA family with amidase domain
MSPKIPQIPPQSERIIEILAFDEAQLLDVAGPLQVFATANEACQNKGADLPYRTRVVAPTPTVQATAGLSFAAAPLSDDRSPIDTLIVAGGRGVTMAARDFELVSWIAQRTTRARRVASVCTGAFMLGAAGLLDGRRAVTHWKHCGDLALQFPAATVEPDPIFICDGPVWTSAGVTAGIDLSLALVEQDLGRAAALDVARHLVVFLKRPGGQSQFSAALTLQSPDDRFSDLHEWIQRNLVEDLPFRQLAAKAGMSERTFSRKYRDTVGMPPSHGVELLRVEAARRLLIETKLPMKRIVAKCGFGTEETMRRTFLRVQGCGPKEYRDRFGYEPASEG